MNLDDLRVFCAVAQQRSFIAASKQLAIPAATVSRRISALEHSLGHPLIHRSTRSVDLSEQGKTLLARAEPLIEEFESLKQETWAEQQQTQGKLRIQIPQELFADNFIECLKGFMADYPLVDVHCRQYLGWSHQAPESFDLTLICYEMSLPDSDWISLPLLSLNQGLFAAPEIANSLKQPLSPEYLPEQKCISRCDESQWFFRHADQLKAINVNSRIKLDSLSQQIKAATQGMGIIKAPLSAVNEQVQNKSLIAIESTDKPVALSVSLYYRSRIQPRRVKVFMDYLQRYLAA